MLFKDRTDELYHRYIKRIREDVGQKMNYEIDKTTDDYIKQRLINIVTLPCIHQDMPALQEIGRQCTAGEEQITAINRINHYFMFMRLDLPERVDKQLSRQAARVLYLMNNISFREARHLIRDYPALIILMFVQQVWLQRRSGSHAM